MKSIYKSSFTFNSILIIFLISVTVIQAQWEQTNGPCGGSLRFVSNSGTDLFVGTVRGNIFKNSNGNWERISYVRYAQDLESFNSKLFVRSDEGLFKSDNGGTSWNMILEGKASTFYKSDNTLFVSVNDTIYKTFDGENWEPALLGTDANTILFGQPTVQQLIDIQTFLIQDTLAILGATTSVYPIPQGIYVSHDRGENWIYPEGIGDQLFARDFEMMGNSIYMASSSGVFKSTDKGLTWSGLNDGLSGTNGPPQIDNIFKMNNQLFVKTNYPRQIYKLSDTTWTSLNLTEEPLYLSVEESDLFFTSGMGIFKLTMQNNSVSDLTDGLIASSVVPFAITKDLVFGWGGSTNFKSEDGGSNWTNFEQFNFKSMLVDQNMIYTIGVHGIYRSSDNGNSWSSSSSGIPASYFEYASGLVKSDGKIYVSFSKIRPRTHLSPIWEAGGVYASSNNGQSWSQVSGGLPQEAGVKVPVTLLYSSDNQLLARTIEGLYRSTNAGASWSAFTAGFPEFYFPLDFAGFKNNIYVMTNHGVYYSDGNVNQWLELNTGLPDFSITTFYSRYQFLVYNEKLYLIQSGEVTSAYLLENGSWIEYNSNLPVGIEFNRFSIIGDQIYAGTIDRGIWKGKLDELTDVKFSEVSPSDFVLHQNYPNPFNPTTKISFVIPVNLSPLLGGAGGGLTTLKVYDLLSKEVATLLNKPMDAGTYEVEFDASNLPSGVYFYKLSAGSFSETKKMLLLK